MKAYTPKIPGVIHQSMSVSVLSDILADGDGAVEFFALHWRRTSAVAMIGFFSVLISRREMILIKHPSNPVDRIEEFLCNSQ